MSDVYFLDTETVSLLQQYGDTYIHEAWIASTPIIVNNMITPALHVYLVLLLDNVTIVMEKNERVELSIYTPRTNETIQSIEMSSCTTVSTSIYNAIRSRMDNTKPTGAVLESFWSKYDLEYNNCQHFVFGMIEANGWEKKGLERFNQGAEHVKIMMEQHMKQSEAPPLAKLVSGLFLHYVSKIATTMVTQRIRDTPKKESSRCMTMDGIIETFDTETPEEACRITEERCVLRRNM